jgi:hypothetical protein
MESSTPAPSADNTAGAAESIQHARPYFTRRKSHVAHAVEQCRSAWSSAYAQAIENNLPEEKALRMAAVAYKLQIPKMDSLSSTKSAFACVTSGISLEVFQGNDASQLLYAAQVATSLYKQKGAKK